MPGIDPASILPVRVLSSFLQGLGEPAAQASVGLLGICGREGAIKQAMLNASGHIILPEFLPESLHHPAPAAESRPPAGFDLDGLIESLLRRGEHGLHAKVIEAVERVLLARVLGQTHGHQSQASEILGLNRTTLRNRLKALGLAVDKVLVNEPDEEVEPPRG